MHTATKISIEDVSVKTVTFASHKEYVLNVAGKNGDAMQEALHAAADKLNAQIIGQFTFAGCSHFDTAGPLNWPFSWLHGDACAQGDVTSMQATAISGVQLTPITLSGKIIGYFYEDEHASYCRLSGLQPADVHVSREEQTRSIFERMAEALKQCDMKFTDTVRTWLYLDHLLDWYDEFNGVRTEFFEEYGVFDVMVPASTGIGAANPQGAAITADLLAIVPKSDAVTIEVAASPLQESAMDYRSSFSRAVAVSYPTHETVYISGSASIAPKGATLHLDDPKAQIELTMDVVTAILNARGMDWVDASRGIAYFKDMASVAIFRAYCTEHGIPEFPLAIAHADVCRHDLLFEIELDGTKVK